MNRDSQKIWLKSAVAGGIWASFEIIVGSFLHNLHVPFSGTALATFSVILMISFIQIWPQKGLIWRAGIICGLMKSLSPSAVILGPMTGIMMEAIIMDLAIHILGLNLIGYIIAGAGALFSTILHKAVNLLILYGGDIVKIYINLFEFLKKTINAPDTQPEDLIIWIVILYLFLGTIAAVIGYFFGKYSVKNYQSDPASPPALDPFTSAWNKTDPNQPFRILLLILHIICLPLLLVLINHFGLKPAAIFPSIIYIGFCIIYYSQIIHRLKKPFFWSQLIIMTVIAVLFWNPSEAASGNLKSGLVVGLEMSFRAIVVVTSFSGLSVEIRNPIITNAFFNHGLSNFYAAVSLAFNSLPVMLDRSAKFRSFFRKPVRSFSNILYEAELWLKYYQAQFEK
jgi:hypothetical protein